MEQEEISQLILVPDCTIVEVAILIECEHEDVSLLTMLLALFLQHEETILEPISDTESMFSSIWTTMEMPMQMVLPHEMRMLMRLGIS